MKDEAADYDLTKEAFRRFVNATENSERYFLSEENRTFLEALFESSKQRVQDIPEGTTMYRARVHLDDQTAPFASPGEMIPKPNMRKEGRVDPYNVPVLYLANSPELAVAETRPSKYQPVTVARFKINRALKVVNFSSDRFGFFDWFNRYGAFSPVDTDHLTWVEVNEAFSKPVSPNESRLRYIPTQIISEYFKHKGYDGVLYRSQFSISGIDTSDDSVTHENYALFDIEAAEMVGHEVYRVNEYIISVGKVDCSQNHGG